MQNLKKYKHNSKHNFLKEIKAKVKIRKYVNNHDIKNS